jgi:ribosomal protein S18 acetylase RimI-like enzyme
VWREIAGTTLGMDDSALRERLWLGFARLQMLLGGQAAGGSVVEREGLVASVVPTAPDSPTLNAAVLLAARIESEALEELAARYGDAKVRRWGVWVDGSAGAATQALKAAGLRPTTSSPGMGAVIDELPLNGQARAGPADLATVGHVNDLAYGNQDGRLERTLAPMPADLLRAYRADVDGEPASVALALDHDGDCGVSFVATAPRLRRQGHARRVMQRVLVDARDRGLTTTTLQATDLGERLYHALGYRYLSDMQLWEQRS